MRFANGYAATNEEELDRDSSSDGGVSGLGDLEGLRLCVCKDACSTLFVVNCNCGLHAFVSDLLHSK
jgi:hypothetical protein